MENKEYNFLSGYSVGQYTALHIGGVLDLQSLFQIVYQRAQCMNEAIENQKSGMLAVIGLKTELVEEVLCKLRAKGEEVYISNYNCLGQLSIAGLKSSLSKAKDELSKHKLRKLIDLPTQGAWHCPLMGASVERFTEVLEKTQLHPSHGEILDNVSGEFLAEEKSKLVEQLSKHLYSPVRWENCIRTMINRGTETFTEVGFGNVLTKFGFFIDRSKKYESSFTAP